jgi:hypothetical protein
MTYPYQNSKSTKRFEFGISRSQSKKAGANVVTIETRSDDGFYATPTVGLTMTVKEARALRNFLNTELDQQPQNSDASSVVS